MSRLRAAARRLLPRSDAPTERLRRNQAAIAWSVANLQSEVHAWAGADARRDGDIRSEHCTQAACTGPFFDQWCRRLGLEPSPDRWRWEKVFLARTFDEVGVLGPGRRGLGFGVGAEPLVAFFAGCGCEVVATDLDPADPRAATWAVDGGLPGAAGLLRRPEVCDPDVFDERVSIRSVDMAAIPTDLRGFDFCWSACALEHLGSLEAGMGFVESSLDCLAVGGTAIHTTELNVSSNEATIESGPTVLYRRRDIEALVHRLESAGHAVAPLDLAPRFGVLDVFESDVPHLSPPALRVVVDGHVTTSVGLVVTKGTF